MADIVADNVVNGNQSMGGGPAPIDAPQETQSTSRPEGQVGDAQARLTTYQLDTSQSQTTPYVKPQSRDDHTSAQQDAPQVGSLNTLQASPDYFLPDPPDTNSGLVNGTPLITSFPDPSPVSADGADLEWRRPSLTSNGAANRSERSNSYKKPTSFKSVSVTKNFLAKSTTGPTSAIKAGPDKLSSPSPTPSATSVAKPRLVAKSVRDARAAPLTGPGTPGGPDASKVWNRNRPAPPPPPRQFTDEELKQQYGIHLATRLQANEPDKGSKWADMEDDEDDWAPDTVEWRDGTKTTLQPENQEPTQPDPRQQLMKNEGHGQDDQDVEQSQPTPTSLGPGKTILRPGARANQTLTRPGVSLRPLPENQAPSPQPTPNGTMKSPWAQLPPIDKVSPVTFVPPSPRQTPSHLAREGAATASTPGSAADFNFPSPAREIAADTFDRSWRSHDRGSRELFDAKSGRYEPAKSGRKSSFRQEGNFRPPSLLQRPSQFEQDKQYSSQDARNFDRRQSTLSTESRVTLDRASSAVEDALTSERATSPLVARTDTSPQESAPPRPSHSDSEENQRLYSAHPADGLATSPNVDGASSDVQLQQQLMRQRIEANRRRKQEEQAREEAEKQERIRQKLLALDVTSPISTKSEERVEEADKVLPQPPDLSQHPDTLATDATPVHTARVEGNPILPESNLPLARGPSASPSRFEEHPHLDGLGEVPISAPSIGHNNQPPAFHSAVQNAHGHSLAPQAQPPGFSTQPIKLSLSPRLASENLSRPSSQYSHPSSHPTTSQYFKPHSDTAQLSSSDTRSLIHAHTPSPASFERSRHHWASAQQSHPQPSWSSTTGPTHNLSHANVWGPPTNDKALGNGAFDPELHRAPYSHPSQQIRQSPQPPGPIAPPSVSPKPQPSIKSELQSHIHSNHTMAPTQVAMSPATPSFPNAPSASLQPTAPAQPPKKSASQVYGATGFDPTKYGKRGASNARPSVQQAGRGNDGAMWKAGAIEIQNQQAARRELIKKERDLHTDKPVESGSRSMQTNFDDDAKAAAVVEEKRPAPEVPSEALQQLFDNHSIITVKLFPDDKAKTIMPTPNGPHATVNLPNIPDAASLAPFAKAYNRGPGYNGSQPIVQNLQWQQMIDDLCASKAGPRTAIQKAFDFVKRAASPASATKPTHNIEDSPRSSKPIVVTPGLHSFGGIKGGDASNTKDVDANVFTDPQTGDRPNIALATDVPLISNDFSKSILQQKRGASPTNQTVSPLASDDETVLKSVKITRELFANTGRYRSKAPVQKPVNTPAPTNAPASTASAKFPQPAKGSNATPRNVPTTGRSNGWGKAPKGPNPPARKNW